MVRHKTDAETQYKNKYISATSEVLNAVLTGLESDTIYEITVHAYNNDGNGTKLKIQVTTEKPDDSSKCPECLKTFKKIMFVWSIVCMYSMTQAEEIHLAVHKDESVIAFLAKSLN